MNLSQISGLLPRTYVSFHLRDSLLQEKERKYTIEEIKTFLGITEMNSSERSRTRRPLPDPPRIVKIEKKTLPIGRDRDCRIRKR